MKRSMRCPVSGRLYLDIDDQDEYTPAIVRIGRNTSTYDCATQVGVVDDTHELFDREMTWLLSDQISNMVEAAFTKAREGNPAYE